MYQVPLVTCILLSYTNITKISVHPLKGRTAEVYTPCETFLDSFEFRNSIVLTVTVCIALFKTIGKLQ